MADARSGGVAPVVAVTAAAVLALSVFLPWYSITITASGAAYAQQALTNAAAQYGNATLQGEVNALGSTFASAAGHRVATVTAHQALKNISVVLLLLAGLSFVGGLVWLTGSSAIEVNGGQVAAVGVVATLLVLYRMVARPGSVLDAFSFALDWGAWVALFSALAIVAGGLIGWLSEPVRR